MKKSLKLATAFAGAAVVVMGGSAFTNSVASIDASELHAYGKTTVEGVTVFDTTYTYDANNKFLQKVKWQLTAATPVINDNDTTGTAVGSTVGTDGAVTCDYTAADGGTKAFIECDWTGNTANVTEISLLVDEDTGA